MMNLWQKRRYWLGSLLILGLMPWLILAQEGPPPPKEIPPSAARTGPVPPSQPESPVPTPVKEPQPAKEPPPAPAAKNIFFLDAENGEPAAFIKELEAKTEPDADTLAKLGFLYYLYRNDSARAQGYFQQALAKDPQNLQALDGLISVYNAQFELELQGKTELQFLQAAPDDPHSELILRYLDDNLSYIRLPYAQRIELMTSLLNKPMKNKINETLVKKELTGYRTILYGPQDADVFQLWKNCGYVDKWITIGYFGPYGDIAFNEVFPPEKKIELDKKYSVLDWEVTYHKTKATITNYDEFNRYLRKPLKNQGTVHYLLTYVKSPSNRWVACRINNSEGYKIWVNDNLVGEINRFCSYQPKETGFCAFLNEGWNKILIKLLASENADIRITDPEGGAYTDLVYEVDFQDNNLPKVEFLNPPAELPMPKCVMGARDTYAEHLKNPLEKTIYDYSRLSTLYEINNLPQESFKLREEVYEAHKDNTAANVGMAHAYETNNYLPEEKRMNQARACAERARELDPKNVVALIWLSNYYESKDKEKTLNYLKEAAKLKPDNLEIHRYLLGYYQNRNWQAEAFMELQAMNKLAPESPVVWSMWRDYYSRLDNHQKAYEYALRRQNYYGGKHDWVTISHREQLGDYEYVIAEELKLIAENPESVSGYKQLIDLYRRLNKYDEAEKAWAKILELESDDDYRYYPELARFYWEWGKPDKAREYWAKTIALPMKYSSYEQANLREFMDFLAGTTDWRKPYEINAAEIIKNAPGEKEYPKVSTIILLEQRLFRVVGDTEPKVREESVHDVIKIMNKKGGEEYGDLWQRGKVEEARVFLPDGRILEPESLQDSGTRLPELDKGSVIDVKYTTRSAYNYETPDRFSELFSTSIFRRPKEPIIRLQYVLIVPKTVKYDLKQHNIGEIKPVITETASSTIYIWDVGSQADYDPEKSMPGAHELFPWAEATNGKFSMERWNQETKSGYLEEKVPDNVWEKALELTQGLTTRDEKVRALYQFCVTEIKGGWGGGYGGRYSRSSGNDTALSQTLIEKEGQIGPLFMAMLRAADIEAYWALARPKFRPYEEVEKNGPGFGDAGLIYLPETEGGKETWLAPGQFVPFGVIPTEIQGGDAYIVMNNGARIAELPASPLEERCNGAMKIKIDIDKNGNCTSAGYVSIHGSQGAQLRMYLKEHATEQEKKMIGEQLVGTLFQGSQVKKFEIPDFQIDERTTHIVFECTAPQFLTKLNNGWRFKPSIRPLDLSEIFLRETERKFPLRLAGFAEELDNVDKMTIVLPEGMPVTLPPNVALWTEFGTYSLSFLQKGNILSIERRFTMKEGDIAVANYSRFVDFCKQVEKAEKTNIYLGDANE